MHDQLFFTHEFMMSKKNTSGTQTVICFLRWKVFTPDLRTVPLLQPYLANVTKEYCIGLGCSAKRLRAIFRHLAGRFPIERLCDWWMTQSATAKRHCCSWKVLHAMSYILRKRQILMEACSKRKVKASAKFHIKHKTYFLNPAPTLPLHLFIRIRSFLLKPIVFPAPTNSQLNRDTI